MIRSRFEVGDGPKVEPSWPVVTGVDLVQDISEVSSPTTGFLRRHRHRIKSILSDGSRTDTFIVDFVDRPEGHRDAVIIAVFSRDPQNPARPKVLLREQLRYACYLVTGAPLTMELLAGILENGERPEEGAHRELMEEAGIEVPISLIQPLGGPFFVLPGVLTERIHPVCVEIPLDLMESLPGYAPPGDGSAFEEGARCRVLPIDEAILACGAHGSTVSAQDAKTELTLMRLSAALASGAL